MPIADVSDAAYANAKVRPAEQSRWAEGRSNSVFPWNFPCQHTWWKSWRTRQVPKVKLQNESVRPTTAWVESVQYVPASSPGTRTWLKASMVSPKCAVNWAWFSSESGLLCQYPSISIHIQLKQIRARRTTSSQKNKFRRLWRARWREHMLDSSSQASTRGLMTRLCSVGTPA